MATVYVRERVARDILARLNTINVDTAVDTAAGPLWYSTTLTAIRRRGFPSHPHEKFHIWQQFGETNYNFRDANGIIDEIARMVLIYSVPDSKNVETVLHQARGDIRLALTTGGELYVPYTLPAGATGECREIRITIIEDEIDFTENIRTPLALGLYAIDVRYSTVIGNPALWDPGDVVVTE